MISLSTNQLVRSNQIEWKPLPEDGVTGIYVKSLQFDQAARRSPTILLKFEAGATYPPHTHPGGEEIFVLEGEIKIGKDQLFAGDYLYTAPNNNHAVKSEKGCILLLKVPQATIEISKHKASAIS